MSFLAALSILFSMLGLISMAFSLAYSGHSEYKSWRWEDRAFKFMVLATMFVVLERLNL